MASLILVSDMDGTLLDDSSRIPPENIAAIRELIAAGGGFTIATGRPVRSIVDHPALRGLITLPVIACNGACLYDTQKQTYLFARRLPDDVQALAARLLAQYPDFGALAFSQADSCTYTLRRTDLTDEVVLRRETVGLHECGPAVEQARPLLPGHGAHLALRRAARHRAPGRQHHADRRLLHRDSPRRHQQGYGA